MKCTHARVQGCRAVICIRLRSYLHSPAQLSALSRTCVLPNGGSKTVPCYSLTKTECLYIATKFNVEARARLALRYTPT